MKKKLQKLTPSRHKLMDSDMLKHMTYWLTHAPVWHLNRRSAARAVLIGLFCAFIPLPTQMFFAAVLCIFARANLPLSIVCVWVTNPLTMAPIFFGTYLLGTMMLDMPSQDIEFQLSWQWISLQFTQIWKPLLLGSFVCGCASAAIGYTTVDLLWRWKTLKKWRQRHS